MRDKTAFFTGHRSINSKDVEFINKKLDCEIRNLIKIGVRYFGVGGAIGFDTLAANMIIGLKEEYPKIKLIMVLPCRNQNMKWAIEQKQAYEHILSKADKKVYISETYYSGCMLERNRHLVNNSDYCIAYLKKNTGGTQYTVSFAKKQNLEIIYI